MTSHKKQIAERYFEGIYNAKDAAAALNLVDEIVADDFVDYSPVFKSSPDKEGFKNSVSIIQTAFKQEYLVEELIQEGNLYVGRWKAKVEHHGTFLNSLPATGKSFTITGITIYEIREGKINAHWEQFDQLGLMRELGLIPME